MKYNYQFDTSSKKFICPNCLKKRFVKYIDANGNYLHDNYGKCDRPKCGYFLKPKMDILNSFKTNKSIFIPQKQKLPSYFDTVLKEKTLCQYYKNDLYNFLETKFDKETIQKIFIKYNVGTSNHWGGSTIFWQVDYWGKVRSGKIMKYSKVTGKRIKGEKPLITWVHSLLKLKDFNLVQVVFGEHLLRDTKSDDVICIVESEKTAIICALVYPQFIWIATGSLYQFKTNNLKRLKGRHVIVFPDTDFYSLWLQKAKEISKDIATDIHISDFLMNITITKNQEDGYDLADYLINC
jgi:hypothetical protein